MIKNVKCVIPNESMKKYLNSKYDISKNINYHIISNAVLDQSIIIQSNKKVCDEWYKDKKLKKIIAVGRLTYQKNFDNLIQAFQIVFEFDPTTRLIIIGEGEDFNMLNDLKNKLNLHDYVKFLGYKKNPYKYIKNSDLFVMNSRWEGPGHVLIEAMCVGCPVITTDCDSGPSDTIKNGKYGLLVKSEEIQQLSESMIYALQNKEEMIFKLNKSKLYLNRFYTEKVTDKYLHLFSI
jgi:glycosyltransferase involved in cell wall biosynthesis